MAISQSERKALRGAITRIGDQAADTLMKHWGKLREVEYKSAIDPVTIADREAESLIVNEIRKSFPDHAILAEEGGGGKGNGPFRWLVDPLDGTVNFAHGLPVFAVSIAVEHEGAALMGLVKAPALKEAFFAERGAGARRNGRRIAVSRTSELIRSLAATGFPYDSLKRADYYLKFAGLALKRTQGIRRLGSAAIDLSYLAMGRFDLYWEENLKPWDVAAGALIAREAGAIVTDYSGGANFRDGRQIAAANPELHPMLLDLIQEAQGLPPLD